MRRLAIAAIFVTIIFLTYRIFNQNKTVSTKAPSESQFTYYNLLHEVKFELPGKYQPEDITYPYGVALYEHLSDEFQQTKSETDFLKSGGIYIKSMRQIPGTKEVFDIFRKQEFEPKLKELGKTLTSETFVTDQGYDAFKTTVTGPTSEVHVVVNAPVAFWLVANSDTPNFQRVYQTFKKINTNEVIEVKKAVSVQESFIADLQQGNYAQAQNKMSQTLQSKFPADSLQTTFIPAKERLNRQLRVFSIRTNGNQAVVRSTLEDATKNQSAFINTNLIQEANSWKVDQFVFNNDVPGQPYQQALNNVKKEVTKEDLLKH